jgi:hypothetical protein
MFANNSGHTISERDVALRCVPLVAQAKSDNESDHVTPDDVFVNSEQGTAPNMALSS